MFGVCMYVSMYVHVMYMYVHVMPHPLSVRPPLATTTWSTPQTLLPQGLVSCQRV